MPYPAKCTPLGSTQWSISHRSITTVLVFTSAPMTPVFLCFAVTTTSWAGFSPFCLGLPSTCGAWFPSSQPTPTPHRHCCRRCRLPLLQPPRTADIVALIVVDVAPVPSSTAVIATPVQASPPPPQPPSPPLLMSVLPLPPEPMPLPQLPSLLRSEEEKAKLFYLLAHQTLALLSSFLLSLLAPPAMLHPSAF